mmetsp:Transcript_61659/g.163311  ORF Transcript_61659/g.163311 Transcript_61659/m.163311 type:complete len:447 (-) Transcript_61659:370-1710(-)
MGDQPDLHAGAADFSAVFDAGASCSSSPSSLSHPTSSTSSLTSSSCVPRLVGASSLPSRCSPDSSNLGLGSGASPCCSRSAARNRGASAFLSSPASPASLGVCGDGVGSDGDISYAACLGSPSSPALPPSSCGGASSAPPAACQRPPPPPLLGVGGPVLCLATGARVGLCGSLACACDHCGAATVEMGSSDSHYNVCISCGAGFPLAPPPPRLLHMLGLEYRSGCDIQPHISTYVSLRLWSFLGMGDRLDVATGVGFDSVLYDRGEEPPFFSRVFHLYRPPCCEQRRRGVLDPPTEPLEPSIPEDDAVDAGSFAAGGAADGTGCAAGGGGGLGETVFLARVAAVDGRAVGSSVSSASPSNSGAPRRVRRHRRSLAHFCCDACFVLPIAAAGQPARGPGPPLRCSPRRPRVSSCGRCLHRLCGGAHGRRWSGRVRRPVGYRCLRRRR